MIEFKEMLVDMALPGTLVGVAATLTMDVLAGVARRLGFTGGARGEWVGRWYLGIAQGRLVHPDIREASELPGEKRAALIGHYIIGIALALAYVLSARWLRISPGALLPALGFGLATCVFPWFLVLPSLGFGPLGCKGPRELRLFAATVMNHSFYGLGLWWASRLVAA